MKFFRLLLVLTALGPAAAHAQVSASLVAADQSIQPGRPFTAALRLEHEPHWHTYWINAGTGYPSSLDWALPEGWSAGDIQWPTPIRILDAAGNVTGNGYEGLLYLPVTLTPPRTLKPGTEVELQATAKWLMCAEICIPGSESVALTLPVSSDPPQPNAAVRAGLAQMPMPASPKWTAAAPRSDSQVTLALAGVEPLRAAHFFSQDGLIQYDAPQVFSREKDAFTLRMTVADDAPDADLLVGVLAYTDEQGAYRGARIEVPFSGADAPALAAGAAGDGVVPAGGASGSSGSSAPGSFLLTLFFAVVGGLILNLMPCVFPVIGIKVVSFVNQAANDRRKITLHGLTFTLGVLVSFWMLAAVLGVLRAGGEELGWGFQLQSPAFVFTLAVVMLVFALSLSGVFEFGLGATGVASNLQMKDGYAGSFFTGVLATVVATPCSAPFLAPALGAAFVLSVSESFLVFTAIALGLSAPYLALSVFPGAVRFLPKPGRWMETFKQAMAFLLYATVGYLVWVLAGQTTENGLLAALIGLIVIAMAAWMYGRYRVPGATPARARFGWIGAVALFAIGAHLGWPRAPGAAEVVWEPWNTERVAALRSAGRPIYVDFTARWCATCQANKKVVFASEEVNRYFREHKVAALRGDWTNADPRITAELARWNRSAIPFNLVYRPGAEPVALPEILTPGIVLAAFRAELGEGGGAGLSRR